MGFLNVNTRKSPVVYTKQGAKRIRLDGGRGSQHASRRGSRQGSPYAGSPYAGSPQVETPPSSSASRENTPPSQLPGNSYDELSPIERLPREVLERIFVLSGNFDLAQSSHVLGQKLSRSCILERELLAQQLEDYNGCVCAGLRSMPTFVARWPFVTAHLLSELEFARFVGTNANGGEADPFVPLIVEKRALSDPQALELAAFMVERGCRVEDSIEMYCVFADNGFWAAVESMANNQHRADSTIVVRALRAGQGAELAIQLLRLSRNIHSDWTQVWTLQQAALEAHVPEISTYLNSG